MNEAAEPGVEPASTPLGQRLREAREARGMDHRQAAGALLVDREIIEALEAEAYDRLGAPVFVRGHLRNYAELLALPAEELLQQYSSGTDQALPPLVGRPRAREPVEASSATARRLSFGVLALVALLFAAWLFARGESITALIDAASAPIDLQPQTTETATVPPRASPQVLDDAATGTAETATQLASNTPAGETAGDVAPLLTDSADTESDTVASAALTEQAPGPQATTPTPRIITDVGPPPADGILIRLQLLGESWVEIRDAGDSRRVYDLFRPGESVELTLSPPVFVSLGNALAVELQLDGEATDLTGVLRRDNTARFTVDAEGVIRR